MSHLGRRVSDLLDGQLSPAETEAAWAHVHTCPPCRDDVEREGWVKTRLSTLSWDDGPTGCAPDRLKGALLGLPPECLLGGDAAAHGPAYDVANRRGRLTRVGMVAIGGGAAGAAVMGVLALGPAPADLPSPERRQPVVQQNPRPLVPPAPVKLER